MKFRTLLTILAGGVAVAACAGEPLADPTARVQAIASGPANAAAADRSEAPVFGQFLADLDAKLAATGSCGC